MARKLRLLDGTGLATAFLATAMMAAPGGAQTVATADTTTQAPVDVAAQAAP